MVALGLFYSYAEKDDYLRVELQKHLSILRRSGIISDWAFRNISAGTDWEQEVNSKLESSAIILLLISADFIASDYCYTKEMDRALEKHQSQAARVIPIILRAVDWQGAPFGRLQALPTSALPVTSWPNRDEAWADVVRGIRAVASELQRAQTTSGPGGMDMTGAPNSVIRNTATPQVIASVGKPFVEPDESDLSRLHTLPRRPGVHPDVRLTQLATEGQGDWSDVTYSIRSSETIFNLSVICLHGQLTASLVQPVYQVPASAEHRFILHFEYQEATYSTSSIVDSLHRVFTLPETLINPGEGQPLVITFETEKQRVLGAVTYIKVAHISKFPTVSLVGGDAPYDWVEGKQP